MLMQFSKKLLMIAIFSTSVFGAAHADDLNPTQSSTKPALTVSESASHSAQKHKIKLTREERKANRMERRKARQSKKKFRQLMERFRKQMLPPRMILKQKDKLGLSEEQLKQIQGIMKSAKAKQNAQQSTQQNLAMAFEQKLAQWEKAETQVHEEQLLTAMQAYLSSEKSWREERLMTSLKVRKILSLKQREKLLELRKGFWSRQDQAGGHKKKARKEERRQRRLDRLERRMERLEQRKADAN